MNLISLFITSLLTENIILTKFLGICPFMGVSKKEDTAFKMGIAVTLVVTLSSIITYILYHLVLIPNDATYLKTIMFILVIASLVQILEIVLKKYSNTLYKSFGIYLPLITTNCAVLGITLINVSNDFNFLEMLTYSIGSSLGFTLVIYIFSTIRERLESSPIIPRFKGAPIALITAGIMALVFARVVI